MKYCTLVFLLGLLSLIACNDQSAKDSLARAKREGYTNYEILNDSVVYHYIYRSGYNWYIGQAASFTVENTDLKTFQELTHKYAKDSSSIFYKGFKLANRDVKSFKILDRLTTSDKIGVYLKNKIIKGSHSPSFRLLGNNYAIDKNQAYYIVGADYKILKGVDIKTVRILDCKSCFNHFLVDSKSVFLQGEIIKSAHPKTFKGLSYEYSQDDEHIFFRNQILKGVDYDTFRTLKKYVKREAIRCYAVDKNHEYGIGENNQLVILKKQ